MSYTMKKLEDMDVMDDFLMERLAADDVCGTDFCRIIISTLLQKKIGRLRVSAQKMIPSLAPHLRGIRMDVEVEELGDVEGNEEPTVMNIYDMEPHLQKDMNLPRRNRFYQAKLDSREENVTDEATAELHNYVSRAKVMPEVKNVYMKLEEFIYYQRKEEREEAVIDTMVQAILDILEDFGNIPERVTDCLKETNDKDTLKRWHRLAAKVNSMKEFEEMLFPGSVTQ